MMIEDTDFTYDDIFVNFGLEVAEGVESLTKIRLWVLNKNK